jgi:hypothetical protein
MTRDIPYVGVTFSPETSANSDWYLRSIVKSNANTPTSTTPDSLFSNITNRTYGFSTRRGSTYELGRVEAGECQLAVDNSDGTFDPNNSSGTYYPNIKPYRPIAVNCAYPITGNILNDSNLAPAVPVDAPTTYANNRISVGVNDGNFELGAISNWWTSGTATIVTSSTSPFAGIYKAIVTSPNNSSYAYLDVPVVAGKQIVVSLYYQSAVAAQLSVLDGGLGSTTITNTTLAIAGSWTRASVTLTPNSPKITIRVGYLAASATVSIDNVQVEFGSTASTYTTTGSIIYSLFNGFVERYPQTYQAPNRGQVNMFATDSLASISQNDLVSPYEALIAQDAALYYYPFGDSANSLITINKSIYTQNSMYLRTLGTETPSVFGNANSVDGLPNTAITNVSLLNNYTGYDNNKPGTFLTLENVENVNLKSGGTYTFSFWYQWDNDSLGYLKFRATPDTQWTNFYQDAINIGGIELYIDGLAEQAVFNLATPDGTSVGGSVVASVASTTEWQMIAVELGYSPISATTGSYTVKVRTSLQPNPAVTNLGNAIYIPLQSFSLFGFDANIFQAQTQPTNFSNFAIHQNAIDFNKYTEAATGLYGDSTGERFSKFINDYSGMDYLPYATDYGQSYMQYAKTYGISLADYIQTISDTEGGYWYVDGEGFVTFKDRWNRLQKLVPSVTFGDGAGETPYAGGDLVINYDPTYVLNDVIVSRENGITVQAQDLQSIADYFPRSYSRVTQNSSDAEVADAANFLLSRYKDPHARPEIITLTPARNPSIWAIVLGLEIGDYVKVNKRPLGASAISINCFIEAIAHDYDGQTGDWIVKVTVSPAIANYWNLSTIQATTIGAASAGNLVLNKTGASNPDLKNPRDITAGQMLQYTISGTTYVDVVSGIPTETATTVTVPVLRVGTITATTNTIKTSQLKSPPAGYAGFGIIPVDWNNTSSDNFGILSNASQIGITKFLIDGELMDGAVTAYSTSGYGQLKPSARAINSTTQSVQGSTFALGDVSLTNSRTASHVEKAIVYGVAGTSGGNVAAGTIVTEYLPNQITRIPYTPFNYSNLNAASTIGSWTNTLYSGTLVTTTPASSIKYNAATMNPLVDQTNFPASDLAIGQILSFYNNTAIESFAIVSVGAPAINGTWSVVGYKIIDSSQTVSVAVTPDAATITCSGAVTASAILIGNEFMQVTAGSGTSTLTVTRGTPDAAVWSVLSVSRHYQYDKIYTVVNAGLTNTYAASNAIIEGYNVSSPVIGTTRLGY